MESRFSQAATITSTPSVIQFSTISFCLAGSELIGPSNLRSALSSAAAVRAPFSQVTKYWLPLLLGSRAMVSLLFDSDLLQEMNGSVASRAREATKVLRFMMLLGLRWVLREIA